MAPWLDGSDEGRLGSVRPLVTFHLSLFTNSLVRLWVKQMDRFRGDRKVEMFAGLTAPLLVDLGYDFGVSTKVDLKNGGRTLRFNHIHHARDGIFDIAVSHQPEMFRSHT